MRALVVSHLYLDPDKRGKLRALAGLGCSIAVALPDRWVGSGTGPTVSAAWATDAGIRLVPVPVRGSRRNRAPRWSGRAIRRLLTDFRPQVIQIEEEPWTQVAAATTTAAARLGIPALGFSWESNTRGPSWLARWRFRRTLARLRAVIGGNRAAAAWLAQARPGIPSGVIPQLGILPPLEVARPAREGSLAIAFVGRAVPEKGLDVLFRACVKLLGRWTLTVVGSGPAQEELEGLAERLGIAARVAWLGALPASEWDGLWSGFDCLVVPSRTTPYWRESFSWPVVKAMGYGVPVIASESGALPEIVDTAGLVVPEDDVTALTAALQHLIDAPRERQRISREGRQRVMAEYTDDAIARKTLEFWERVVLGQGGKAVGR